MTGSPRIAAESRPPRRSEVAEMAGLPRIRLAGFPWLVAERNPYTMTAGQDLPVRLTYQNRPLAGTLVVAINRANPAQKLSARSGKDGRRRQE